MSKYILAMILLLIVPNTYANIANTILLSRTTDQKTQILSNIINAAGEPCIATNSFFQGVDIYDSAYWNISCSNGQSYVIQIENNEEATTTIFQCNSMRSLGAECFKKFGS